MNRDNFFAPHPMFKRAVSSVKRSSGDSLKNLLEFRENYVFVWSAADGALLVANVDSSDESYQTLRLISAPSFPVERVSVCAGCTRACLWGARGVLVAELPPRLLTNATPTGGAAALCKSFSLDERFLLSQAEVRRVHWHPESLQHLLVLVSDNTIRLYNLTIKSLSKLVKLINIGPTPSSRLAGRPILESLGDTAVDFDFVPGGNRLLVLRGNGDVYTVNVAVGNDSGCVMRGPLAMSPPADDNYGSDSCSMLVLGGGGGPGSAPPLVVIATSCAVLYHCLLLPDASANDLNKTQDGNASDLALFVVECVELNIVLGSEDLNLQYSYPVHLYPIANKNERYAIMHAAGVHTVTLPIMSQLKEYADAEDCETEAVLSHLLSRASVARYMLCTHAPGSGFEPPLGLCSLPPATLPSLLVLLENGEPVTRSLDPYNLEEQLYSSLQDSTADLGFQRINSLLKEREKMSFSAIIQDILTRSVSQPLLKMSTKEEPSPKEAIELLAEATMKLSSEYMRKQERCASVIRNKLHDITTLRDQQLEWFQLIQVQAEDVTSAAATLRERCANAIKKQSQLRERCWAAIRSLRSNSPLTTAEREMLSTLQTLLGDVERDRERVQTLSTRASSNELKKWQDEYKRKDVCLGRSHSDTISAIIQQQGSQLSSLIEDTKLLKDQLSLA